MSWSVGPGTRMSSIPSGSSFKRSGDRVSGYPTRSMGFFVPKDGLGSFYATRREAWLRQAESAQAAKGETDAPDDLHHGVPAARRTSARPLRVRAWRQPAPSAQWKTLRRGTANTEPTRKNCAELLRNPRSQES